MKCPKCGTDNKTLSTSSKMTPRGTECVTHYFYCEPCEFGYRNKKYKNYHKSGHPSGRPCIQTR